MRAFLLIMVLLAGCASIVPKTANQALVVSYSQITTLALDVGDACRAEVLTPVQCSSVKGKLQQALQLMNDTSDLVLVGKLLAEVKEIVP